MDPRRFDALTRRLSRRATARGFGVGATLTVLGAAWRPTTAQDATPAVSPAATPTAGGDEEVLFVQTFASGAWAPKPDAEGSYLLALTGPPAETVYFADRPARDVGTVSTERLLDFLGFGPDDPPNAAVVVRTPDGDDVVVVELLNPVLATGFEPAATTTLTYEARPLAAYAGSALAEYAARQDDDQLPAAFGSGAVFIDGARKGRGAKGDPAAADCGTARVHCLYANRICTTARTIQAPSCWKWEGLGCYLCSGSPNSHCQREVPACAEKNSCNGMLDKDWCRRCGGGGQFC